MDTQTERIKGAPSVPARRGPNGSAAASRDGLARSSAPAGSGHRLRWWRDALRRRMLAAADLVAAALATILVTSGSAAGVVLLIGLPVWILVAKMLGLYDRDHIALRHLTADEIPTLLAWMTVGVAALALIAPAVGGGSIDDSSAIRAWLGGVLSAVVLRAIARGAWRRLVPAESTLIVGDGELA